MEEIKLVLTDLELRRYEEASWILEKLNLEMNLKRMEQQLYQAQLEAMNLKIKLATRDIGDKSKKIKDHRKKHSEFNKEVCKRLGLEEGERFAYDPLTGEVDPINERSVNE